MENAAMQQASYDPRERAANGGYGSPKVISAAGVMTPLDDLSKSLDVARDRIGGAIQRAKAIADSLMGPEAETKPIGPDHPPRMGRMGSLGDQAEFIHSTISELERQIHRIGSIG
jgi:hypothetical protein